MGIIVIYRGMIHYDLKDLLCPLIDLQCGSFSSPSKPICQMNWMEYEEGTQLRQFFCLYLNTLNILARLPMTALHSINMCCGVSSPPDTICIRQSPTCQVRCFLNLEWPLRNPTKILSLFLLSLMWIPDLFLLSPQATP